MAISPAVQMLHQTPDVDGIHIKAIQALESPSDAERLAGAYLSIDNSLFNLFPTALSVLKPLHQKFEYNLTYCSAAAYAAWVTNDVDFCSWASKRCIVLNPKMKNGYLLLGLAELGREQFTESFCVLSAGLLNCASHEELGQWQQLASLLMQGTNKVKFVFDELEFIFTLSVFNTQAMELALYHLAGCLYEHDELRYARQFVGPCDCIVEVGALVGNHTIYFAKALQPGKIRVFDANLRAVNQIRENVVLNGLNEGTTEIVVKHAAVGNSNAGQINMFGRDVSLIRLDDEVKDRVDFIKIDVDGMELDVLDGCRGILNRDRPKIMVEVQREQRADFLAFLHNQHYTVKYQIDRLMDTNYFISPE